ncbi:glycosyl transferase family protein [Qipengyuania sp.]|uniref:glycosyl transferase family protein n=1 Tax=Qipengyuania sp. TaxID=2004515 RepID=UPI0035C833DE
MAAGEWLLLARQELFLFTGCFFLIGAIDEMLIDVAYLVLHLTGRIKRERVDEACLRSRPLRGRCCVFIPAWQEERVIATTLSHISKVWPQADLLIFVGCYNNDPRTIDAVRKASFEDPRIRMAIHASHGPTCKADCLNRIFREMEAEENASGRPVRMVILHDAEDLVDPAAINLLDQAIGEAAFVQLPVLAMPHPRSPWISGHYSDEFAESHAKTMVVRAALARSLPGAGVGCAIAREHLERLSVASGGRGPFATGALTEDYEPGIGVAAWGGKSSFLRIRTTEGRLIATRAYFPTNINAAVRQKARWIHGIALQGWDRLGWNWSPVELWMRSRDRRGPLAAFLLFLAYFLVVLFGIELMLRWLDLVSLPPLSSTLDILLFANLLALAWRALSRSLFTWREHGRRQALLAIPRIVVSNAIAIVAARRAVFAYIHSLMGGVASWDKTEHFDHPIPAIEAEGSK